VSRTPRPCAVFPSVCHVDHGARNSWDRIGRWQLKSCEESLLDCRLASTATRFSALGPRSAAVSRLADGGLRERGAGDDRTGSDRGGVAFIDPLIADLGMSRSAVSTAYLVGTLSGAAALPAIGRAGDRYGARRCMVVFGTVLTALSLVSGIVGLTAGFVGIRLTGQGALGLAATTVTAHWFHRRRGMAMSVVSAVGAAGISLTPLLLERLIAHHGWRTAWLVEGVLVLAVVLPVALFGIRDRPGDIGQHVDGRPGRGSGRGDDALGMSRAQAVRTPYFWVLAGAVAVSGLLTTAVAFHQISLLTARGLSGTEAAANFLPQTVAGIAAALLAGALVDRTSHG
jgi:MFS family permease